MARTTRSTLVRAAIWSAVGVGASIVIVVVALSTADGVVRIDDNSSHRTEFIDGAVLQVGWLVLGAFVAAGRHRVWVAAIGVLGVATVHVVAAAAVVRRYEESGWSDGLEVFAYLYPGLMFLGGAVAVALGAALGHTQRRAGAVTPPPPPG